MFTQERDRRIKIGDWVRVCGPVDAFAGKEGEVVDRIGACVWVTTEGATIQRKPDQLERQDYE